MICPRCGNKRAHVRGYLKDGRKRYGCVQCGKLYSEHGEAEENLEGLIDDNSPYQFVENGNEAIATATLDGRSNIWHSRNGRNSRNGGFPMVRQCRAERIGYNFAEKQLHSMDETVIKPSSCINLYEIKYGIQKE